MYKNSMYDDQPSVCQRGLDVLKLQSFVVVIYCHLSKLSVGQTPRLCNLPSKSYSNKIYVSYTGGNDLVNESVKPFNGMPIKF